MGKEDRRRIVLYALSEQDWALPPRTIFRNLKQKQGIPFEYGSVDNYLEEFVEEGLVRRVDPKAMENGELEDMPRGKENRAYYKITQKGRDYLQDSS